MVTHDFWNVSFVGISEQIYLCDGGNIWLNWCMNVPSFMVQPFHWLPINKDFYVFQPLGMKPPCNIQVCCSNSIHFDYRTVFRNELHMKVGDCLYVSDCTVYCHIRQSNTQKLKQKMCCYSDKALLSHFQWQHSKWCFGHIISKYL